MVDDMPRPRISVDILQNPSLPIPLGNAPRLPLRIHSPAHSSSRREVWFDFEALAPLQELAHVVVEQFIGYVSGKSRKTALLAYFCVMRSWKRLAADDRAQELIVSMDGRRWATIFEEWARAERESVEITATTANQYIRRSNSFLVHLQRKGVLPTFKLPDGVKGASLTAGRKPSVGHVPPKEGLTGTVPPEVLAAGPEVNALWIALSKQMDQADPAAMLERIDLMLGRLREVADAAIREIWNDHLDTIKAASETPVGPILEMLERSRGRYSVRAAKGRGTVSVFANEASLFSYIEHTYYGIVPTRHEDARLYNYLANRRGVRETAALFALTPDTAIPFLVVLLIETSMSVSSALDLRTTSMTCADAPDDPTLKRLNWFKDRGRGAAAWGFYKQGSPAALRRDGQGHISVPQAVDCLIALRRRIEPLAAPEDSNALFLVRMFGRQKDERDVEPQVAALFDDLEIKAWKRFRDRDPILSQFPLRLDGIHTALMLKAAIESGNDIFRVRNEAHHASLGTTARYLETGAVHSVNQGQAREVQSFIFVSATTNLEDVRTRLGIDETMAQAILGKARRKGFGSWSNQRREDFDDDLINEDDPFVRWLAKGQTLVIEDEQVAAEMVAFRRHILSEADSLRTTTSWPQIWAPMLLFLNAGLTRMATHVRLEGERIADELEMYYSELD